VSGADGMAYGSENEHPSSCAATSTTNMARRRGLLLRPASRCFDLESETTPPRASCNLGHGNVRRTRVYTSKLSTQFYTTMRNYGSYEARHSAVSLLYGDKPEMDLVSTNYRVPRIWPECEGIHSVTILVVQCQAKPSTNRCFVTVQSSYDRIIVGDEACLF
jgi:hypothetical protein